MPQQAASWRPGRQGVAPIVARLISFLACALSLETAPAAARPTTAVPPARGGRPAAPPWSGVSGVPPLLLTRARVTLPPVRHPAIHPVGGTTGRPLFPRAQDLQRERRERAGAMERHPAGKARGLAQPPQVVQPEHRAGPDLPRRGGPAPSGAAHRVQPGDSLWSIAASMSPRASAAAIAELTRQIYEINRTTIGNDPDVIHPGQSLSLPRQCRK